MEEATAKRNLALDNLGRLGYIQVFLAKFGRVWECNPSLSFTEVLSMLSADYCEIGDLRFVDDELMLTWINETIGPLPSVRS